MIIVKLGGSLYASAELKLWCDYLANTQQLQVIIVPGGGPFADQVRHASSQWNLSELNAHKMAMLAMQQYGLLISNLNTNLIPIDSYEDINSHTHCVWMPFRDVLNECDYPENWQTSSDSLALWLANKLSVKHLCIVKSAQIEDKSNSQLIHSNIVDEYFPVAAKKYLGSIHFYCVSQFKKFLNDIHHGKFD